MRKKSSKPVEHSEEIRPLNPWPIAVAASLAIQAIIILELMLPARPHLAAHVDRPPMRPAGVYLDPGAATFAKPAASLETALKPDPPVDTLPMIETRLDLAAPPPVRPPAASNRGLDTVPPRRLDAAPPPGPAAVARPERAPAKRAALPTRAEPIPPVPPARRERPDGDPAFDSVGDWLQAMSRMRHGDFAPRRP